jgi:hypothetical protein
MGGWGVISAFPGASFENTKEGTMAKDNEEDPVQQAADEELRSAKLAEDATERVAAELTRIRFELTAIRKQMAHRLAEQLKRSSKGGKPPAVRKTRRR